MLEQTTPVTPDTNPSSKNRTTFREVLTRIVHTDRFKDILFGVAGGLIGIATSYLTRNLDLQSWNLLRWIPSFIKPSHIVASWALLVPGIYKFSNKTSWFDEISSIQRGEEPLKYIDPVLHRGLWILVVSNFISSALTPVVIQ